MRTLRPCFIHFCVTVILTALAASPGFCEGAIVFFEEHGPSGDVQLRAQRLSNAGELLWLGGKGSVEVAGRDDLALGNAVATRDGAGGAIVVFEAKARSGSEAGDTDIWAQRVNGDGRLLWNNGTPVIVGSSIRPETDPLVISDGAGGAIVAYAWHDDNGLADLEVQRVSAAGALMWGEPVGERPVDVVESDEDVSVAPEMAIAPDGAGGAIVAYQVTYTSGEYAGDSDIMAQRISSGGERLWTAEEMGATVSSTKHTERRPSLVSDGRGGVIAVLEHEYRSGEYAGDCDIFAQRLSAHGKMLWNSGEKSSTACSSRALETGAGALPDGNGGALVICEAEYRSGEDQGDVDIFAQRLNGDGAMLWNEGESSFVLAGSKWREKNAVIIPDGAGGALVVFEQYAPPDAFVGDIDVAAERLTADGDSPWSTGEEDQSVDISAKEDYLEQAPAAVPDGSGGMIVVFEAEARVGKLAGHCDLLAQRLGANGEALWNGGQPITVAGAEVNEKRPVVVAP